MRQNHGGALLTLLTYYDIDFFLQHYAFLSSTPMLTRGDEMVEMSEEIEVPH
jgi:hypothetical protein